MTGTAARESGGGSLETRALWQHGRQRNSCPAFKRRPKRWARDCAVFFVSGLRERWGVGKEECGSQSRVHEFYEMHA